MSSPAPDGFTVESVMCPERPDGGFGNWHPMVTISGPKDQQSAVMVDFAERTEAAGYEIDESSDELVSAEKTNDNDGRTTPDIERVIC